MSLALLDAGVPMIAIVTSATCSLLPDGNLFLDPSLAEEEVPTDMMDPIEDWRYELRLTVASLCVTTVRLYCSALNFACYHGLLQCERWRADFAHERCAANRAWLFGKMTVRDANKWSIPFVLALVIMSRSFVGRAVLCVLGSMPKVKKDSLLVQDVVEMRRRAMLT